MSEEALVPTIEPERDDVASVLPKLSGLQKRYLAARLIDPSRDAHELLNELAVPASAAYRWKFPLAVERAIENSPAELRRQVTQEILEASLPRAAQKLIAMLDSPDEKIALRAAERLLSGQGLLSKEGTTINIGGDHRRIDVRAAELWAQAQDSGQPLDSDGAEEPD